MLLSCLPLIPVHASVVDEVGPESPEWSSLWQTIRKHVQWDLEYLDGTWTSVRDLLTIDRQYPQPNKCKITLDFITAGAGSYRLTFAVDLKVRKHVNKTLQHVWVLHYQNFTLTFDWSDIAEIPNLIIRHGVKDDLFWFRIRKDNIPANYHVSLDPSIVAETNYNIYGSGFQRKSFYHAGWFYQFFADDSIKLYYSSSVDGSTWADPPTYVRDGTPLEFSTWFNGTHIHYVYCTPAYGGMIHYRSGVPADGVITWDAVEQDVYNSTGWMGWDPTIAVDSNGYPFIFTHWEKSSDFNRLVIKSDANDGTWNTQAGYPLNLTQHDAEPIDGVILPLSDGDMYVIWSPYETNTKYYGRLYDGSWQSNVTICDVDKIYLEYFSAVSRNDDIHMVFVNNTNPRYIDYINYTSGSWGTQEQVKGPIGAPSSHIYALALEDADTEFYVYYNWYFREDMGDWTDYLHGTSGSWSSGQTIVWEGSQPISSQLTSFRENWGGFHSCSVVTIASPTTIEIFIDGSDVPAPTFDAWASVGTVEDLTQFWINLTIGNQNSYGALASCTLELDSGVILKWDYQDVVLDSYTTTEEAVLLRDLHPSSFLYDSACGQSFEVTTAGVMSKASFFLLRYGSPSGLAYIHLYSFNQTSDLPYGDPLAISEPIDIASIDPSGFEWRTLDFNTTNQYVLNEGWYFIAFGFVTSGVLDDMHYIAMSCDWIDRTHEGTNARYDMDGWWVSVEDMNFYVYRYHFTKYKDDQNLCQLLPSSLSSTVGTTQRNLNFSLKLDPSYPEGPIHIHESNTVVTDHWGNTDTEPDFSIFNFTRTHFDWGSDEEDVLNGVDDVDDVVDDGVEPAPIISLPVIPAWGYWVIGGAFALFGIGIVFKKSPSRRRPKGVRTNHKRSKRKDLKGRSKSTGRFK